MKRGTLAALGLALVCFAPAHAQSALHVSLDFFVNPNHVPLIVSAELGFFAEAGVAVDLFVPANPSDPVKLAASRAIDVAITPQINYLIARSEGLPLIAIGALVDRDLGGLLALRDRGIETMADLRGGRIGYSLAPLEPVLWRTMLACAGIAEDEVQLINVGFNTMQSLLAGSVDAIGAFRNFEPIQAQLEGREPVFFPQEEHCVPATYDLLFVVHPDLVEERGEDLRAFLCALARGILVTKTDSTAAFAAFAAAYPDLDDELNRRSFDATIPLYADGARHDDPQTWLDLRAFLIEQGLIGERIPTEGLFTEALLPLERRCEG